MDHLWGVDRLASLNPTTGTRAWYGYDGQGSARQLLNDAGHVTASANYDPYGSPEGAALPSPFGYTGELTDPATGSQYLRARWYRPGQGSLLGVDPLLAQTGQAYSYAGDNPANGSDPSGRCTVRLGGRAYSYLGAEGPGPCSDVLTAALAGAYRADGTLPCLRVLPGRVELLGNGVVPAFVGQPVEAGLPVLGAAPLLALGALGTGEGTTLGEAIAIGIARALPEGLPEGIIGVGVAIFAGILIGVLTVGATGTAQQPEDFNQMRYAFRCSGGERVCELGVDNRSTRGVS